MAKSILSKNLIVVNSMQWKFLEKILSEKQDKKTALEVYNAYITEFSWEKYSWKDQSSFYS